MPKSKPVNVVGAFVVFIIAAGLFFFIVSKRDSDDGSATLVPSIMKLTSNAFGHNESIPLRYTCDGENINPPLLIENVPREAKELVLMMDDPDAPAGTWTHWTVWGVSPSTTEISEHSIPSGGKQGLTSFGTIGYGGPCPPSGTHRYSFRVYALDTRIVLAEGAALEELERALGTSVIDRAEIVGLYGRD